MKKIIMILTAVILVTSTIWVNADSVTVLLPGGKNYLNPDNFLLEGNVLTSQNNIYVKQNQEYTISFPGFDFIGGNIYLYIEGDVVYYDGLVSEGAICTISASNGSCTFSTIATESDIAIGIQSEQMSLFYSYYEMETFQMEEGILATDYEPYQPSVIEDETPVFDGTGAYILSYQNRESIQTIIDNHIVVMDDVDGVLTEQIIIESDEYTGSEGIVGLYDVALSVTDSSSNTANFVLTVIVKDEIIPLIYGPENITVAVHTAQTITDIINANFNYYDDYEDIVQLSIASDQFTASKSHKGTYNVMFEVMDASMNKNTKEFTITVEDMTSPVLTSSPVVTIYTSDTRNSTTIVNNLVFTDNYDLSEALETSIINDTYTGNENIPGQYIIETTTKDTSDNAVESIIDILVVDDELPIISGPINYSFSYTELHSLADIVGLLTVSDNVDDITLSDVVIVHDNYSGNENVVGEYHLEVSLTDAAGNIEFHSISLQVIDDIPPIIYVDNYIVTLAPTSTFTSADAISLLLNTNEIPLGEYLVIKTDSEYEGNENTPGIYNYKIELEDKYGNTFYKDFVIRVTDTDNDKTATNVMIRNIVVYSTVIGIIAFLYYKKK